MLDIFDSIVCSNISIYFSAGTQKTSVVIEISENSKFAGWPVISLFATVIQSYAPLANHVFL